MRETIKQQQQQQQYFIYPRYTWQLLRLSKMETNEDATKDEKTLIGENLQSTRYLNQVISKLKTNAWR